MGARGGTPQRGQQRGGRGSGPPVRGRGGAGPTSSSRTIHTGTDKNLYVHLLALLKKKTLLPVVVFTFSKKRCEENASTLTNQDFCSSVEKSEVHVAIEKALSRLKGSFFLFAVLVLNVGPNRDRQEIATNSTNAGPTQPRHWRASRRSPTNRERGMRSS